MKLEHKSQIKLEDPHISISFLIRSEIVQNFLDSFRETFSEKTFQGSWNRAATRSSPVIGARNFTEAITVRLDWRSVEAL